MSTNQLRRYLDLLNEADVVPPNTTMALPSSGTFSNDDALAAAQAQQNSEPRCAVCGTPQSQHQNLKHQFVPGGSEDRPAPVPQAPVGGDDNLSRIARIKQLQRELLAAGANLGRTGANRDGIDGDIGPLTRAAMQKYPDIAVKYADLPAGQNATPGNTAQLNSALTAIESILAKYKVKLSEDITSSIMEAGPTAQQRRAYQDAILRNLPPDTVAPAETPGFLQSKIKGGYVPPASTPTNPYVQRPGGSREAQAWQAEKAAQQAAQTASAAGAAEQGAAAAAEQGAAAAAEKGLAKGAAGMAGKTLGRVAPGLGLALGATDAYSKAKEGDYVGAGISGLAGIASLFPGPGSWISGGLLALGAARDLTKAPTVAITAADAKTIADNIKIIQDWQKDPANQTALTPELKNRIANVLKGVASVGVPTQSAQPATAAQPATTPAANPKLDQINQTLDSMDQLLKKNKYESVNKKKSPPLTEAEHMARLRGIVTEDWTDIFPDLTLGNALTGYGLFKAGQASKPAAGAGAAGAAPAGAAAGHPAWLIKLNTRLAQVIKAAKMVTGAGIKFAIFTAGLAAVLALVNAFKEDPNAAQAAGIDAADIEQFAQLYTQLNQITHDKESFNSLPPEVQQKATAVAKRALDMAADIANRKSREP